MEETACEYESEEILLTLLILSKCLIVFAAPLNYPLHLSSCGEHKNLHHKSGSYRRESA